MRGIVLEDQATSMIQHNLPSDKRMFHLTCSLRDRLVAQDDTRLYSGKDRADSNVNREKRSHKSSLVNNKLQLLSHPRIVNATQTPIHRHNRSEGIACMDLDRGYNHFSANAPSRYLLVGSAGVDCSIALYDLSYFGSDECLYQKSQDSSVAAPKRREKIPMAAVTHRPIARSVRHNEESIEDSVNIGGVPSGHRQPLLGVHWYPADHGSFVSASISGEILVWDAELFVPVYATTTHAYGGHSNVSEVRRSVAPLQCVDLPKSPDACPHGNALLALGLGGGDGRSVIQLCDAFNGGSATHELLGHAGGVNAVAWDPTHPFRLASAGEDGTVRLWDVRKAGKNACLGILDRNHGYADVTANKSIHSTKRQRISINDSKRMEGIESHGVPVAAIAFAPGGEELVSSGSDGSIHLWDLRPDSCYVSSIVATVGKRKYDTERGGMDSSIAYGGRLYPHIFQSNKIYSSQSHRKRRKRSENTSSLAIVQEGSRDTTTLFVATSNPHTKGQIASYSFFKSQETERNAVLHGHLNDITCLIPVTGAWDNLGVGCSRDNNNLRLLSAGKDGIILSWGISERNDPNAQSDNLDTFEPSGSRSHILSMLKLQRQHMLERLNRQYRDGLISGRDWRDTVYETVNIHHDTTDVDNW